MDRDRCDCSLYSLYTCVFLRVEAPYIDPDTLAAICKEDVSESAERKSRISDYGEAPTDLETLDEAAWYQRSPKFEHCQ